MAWQDDAREHELVRMCNLTWDPEHQRGGIDAFLDVEVDAKLYRFEVEVKSTTKDSVSTARDVGMEHFSKWRRKLFVIGFYKGEKDRRAKLLKCLCLTPVQMEPWIGSIESKISLDYKLAERAARLLELRDLYDVYGEQPWYTLQDAKKVHKLQWSAKQYKAALDMTVDKRKVLSPMGMLEVLRLRSRYIAERGATLNNPKISSTHLAPFFGSESDLPEAKSAEGIRRLAAGFVHDHPHHAAVIAAAELAAAAK